MSELRGKDGRCLIFLLAIVRPKGTRSCVEYNQHVVVKLSLWSSTPILEDARSQWTWNWRTVRKKPLLTSLQSSLFKLGMDPV